MRKIICAMLLISLLCFMVSCKTMTQREKEYYSDQENFMTIEGTLQFINVTDNNMIYLGIEFLESNTVFSDDCFKLNVKNSKIVQELHFTENVQIGDRITLISAPKYFGDGYVYPIVELFADEKTYLEFEEGYQNFMADYE